MYFFFMVTISIPEKNHFKSICRNNIDGSSVFRVFSTGFGVVSGLWTFGQTFEMSTF